MFDPVLQRLMERDPGADKGGAVPIPALVSV